MIAFAAVGEGTAVDVSAVGVQRSFSYLKSAGQGSTQIPDRMSQEGKAYELSSVSEAVSDSAWEAPTQTFTESVTRRFDTTDADGIRASFASQVEVAAYEPGYRGTLGLSSVQLMPVYASESRQVDRVVSFSGLPDNDVARIPSEQVFSVSSYGNGEDGQREASLSLSDIAYTVELVDSQGLPTSYRADCCYRGEEEFSQLVGYDATAVYTGTGAVDDEMLKVTALYIPLEIPAEPTPTSAVAETSSAVSFDEPDASSDSMPWAAVGALGTAVGLSGSFFLLYRFKRKKA